MPFGAIASLFKKDSGSYSGQGSIYSKKRRGLSPSKIIGLAVLVVLVAGVLIVYPAAKNYYVSLRTHDQANAELAAVESRNSEIQDRIDTLKTKEGMEDYVRAQYGWVKPSDNAVLVSGLGTRESDVSALPASISAGSVVAEDSKWQDILDMIFFVDDDTPTATDSTLTTKAEKERAAAEAAAQEAAAQEAAAQEAAEKTTEDESKA